MTEQQQEIEFTGCKHCGIELDKETYEATDDICINCSAKRLERFTEFNKVHTVISKLIYGEVSKSDLNLLHQLIMHNELEPDVTFEINQTHLAKKLDWQQSNISRSLKKLIKSGLLIFKDDKYRFGF